jgi:uncharacterized protein YcnI
VAPAEAPVGIVQRYCIRVPSEKSVPTVGLEVQFPDNLEVTAIEVPPGWRGTAHKDRSERIVSASWEGGSILPKQYLEFGVLARNPTTQTTLSWKAIQTYQDASEVHWNGPPRAQFPAALTRVRARSEVPPSASVCSQEASSSKNSH